MKRICHYVGIFAAGAVFAVALGAGRGGTPVFTERDTAQAVLEQRTAQAAVQEWELRCNRAQRIVADQKPAAGDPMIAVLTQALTGDQRARVDLAVAKERVIAMREINGEERKEAK